MIVVAELTGPQRDAVAELIGPDGWPGTPWERIGDRVVMTVESYATGVTLVLSVAPDGTVSQHEVAQM